MRNTVPFVAATTQVGMMPARLPAGAGHRARLLRLAHRGSEVCHKWRAPLLAVICDALVAALADLAVAEYRAGRAEDELTAARSRISELDRRLRVESFEEETVRRDTPELLLRQKDRSST